MIRGPPPKPAQRSERPDLSEPLITLNATVGATLKTALEKRLASLSLDAERTDAEKGEFHC